jgi:transcriptional regulator with XRE-family HTH domain
VSFKSLQDNLRRRLWEEINSGTVTGVSLAERSGLQQAHVSNFLNGRRGLSLEAMDRVLAAQKLSVFDLLEPGDIDERASIAQSPEAEFVNVPLLNGCEASSAPRIMRAIVREMLKYRAKFVGSLRTACDRTRMRWDRFVAMRVDAGDGMSMFPRLLPGATVLLDRHYNALESYRRGENNMYFVRKGAGDCSIRYIESAEGTYVLRPHNPAYPIGLFRAQSRGEIAEHIIGRVAHIAIEV